MRIKKSSSNKVKIFLQDCLFKAIKIVKKITVFWETQYKMKKVKYYNVNSII